MGVDMSLLVKRIKEVRMKKPLMISQDGTYLVKTNSGVQFVPQAIVQSSNAAPKDVLTQEELNVSTSSEDAHCQQTHKSSSSYIKRPRLSIPDKDTIIPHIEDSDENKDLLRSINMKYPLIPHNPKSKDEVMAWAHITYNESESRLTYHVIEPELTKELAEKLALIEEILKDNLDVNFDDLRKEEAKTFLGEKILEVVSFYKLNLNESQKRVIKYYAYRNFIGLDRIEPLMNDPSIEDISCDGQGLPIYVYHRHPNLGSVQTTVAFENAHEIDSFTIKLAQRCERTVSVAEPLLDGSLPDGSRVQATLGTDIARRGSNFTIRKFTEEPLTPMHLLELGTVDETMLSYLWLGIEYGSSMLIVGPTASGKTSMLNALSLFIRPEMKIVSIEDTPELRLPHPNWIPEVSRAGFGFGTLKSGEVTLDDLLKESLRQRPDYIVVGEVRGKETYILFQQIATGHPGLSTMHASSLDKVMDRLITKPIELPPSLIENLDLLIFVKSLRQKNRYMRRVERILEIESFDVAVNRPYSNPVFVWGAEDDSFSSSYESIVLAKIASTNGLKEEEVQYELIKRRKVIRWMSEKGIKSFQKVSKIISSYYMNQEALMELVNE